MRQSVLRGGFTLIEMLVVIAILAILTSISVPAFFRVRMNANITKSANNLKQIGVACRLYSTDNEGFFPSSSNSARASFNLLIPEYVPKTIFQAPTDKIASNALAQNLSNDDLVASDENSYAYYSGIDTRLISREPESLVPVNVTDIVISIEKISRTAAPTLTVNEQTISSDIFKGRGINLLRTDGSVSFENAEANQVRLYQNLSFTNFFSSQLPANRPIWQN